jgi:branched-chain amino acid transport system substrate-binding protein
MIRRREFVVSAATVGVAVTLPRHLAAAVPGVLADKIVFGQAAAFEGRASALGLGMQEGITAAFSETNCEGGVKGRGLELVARDDGFDPAKSAEATNFARRRLDERRSDPRRAGQQRRRCDDGRDLP